MGKLGDWIHNNITFKKVTGAVGGVLSSGLSLIPGVGGALSKLTAKKEGGSVLGNLLRSVTGSAKDTLKSASSTIANDTGKLIGQAIAGNSETAGSGVLASGVKEGYIKEWLKEHWKVLAGVGAALAVGITVLIIKRKKKWRR